MCFLNPAWLGRSSSVRVGCWRRYGYELEPKWVEGPYEMQV